MPDSHFATQIAAMREQASAFIEAQPAKTPEQQATKMLLVNVLDIFCGVADAAIRAADALETIAIRPSIFTHNLDDGK